MSIKNLADDRLLAVLVDIRNWLRVASYRPVRTLLEEALPDAKARMAYQLLDGTKSIEQVRSACRMSPNAVVALTARCMAMGLMEASSDKKRVRLFDLRDFGLEPEDSDKSARSD